MFPSAGPAADAAGPAFLCPPPGGPGLPASVYAAEVIPPPAGGRETSAPPCVVGTSSISLALPRAAGFVLFAVPPLPTEPVGTVGTPTPCRKKQRRARWKKKGRSCAAVPLWCRFSLPRASHYPVCVESLSRYPPLLVRAPRWPGAVEAGRSPRDHPPQGAATPARPANGLPPGERVGHVLRHASAGKIFRKNFCPPP